MTLAALQTRIAALLEERYQLQVPWHSFVEELLELGVTRLSYDAMRNEMSFYNKTSFIVALERQDLADAQANGRWPMGETLDDLGVEAALAALEANQISVIAFHERLATAGVVSCHCFLIDQCIYYLGADGRQFIETY